MFKNGINPGAIYYKIEDDISYQAFWEEIDNKLNNKKTIYLSPDGVYNKINVNTLKKPDGTYLIDEKYVRLVTNTADLVKDEIMPESSTEYKYASLFGFPDYNSILFKVSDRNAVEIVIPELPGTKIEIDKINLLLKEKDWSTKEYLRTDACEDTVKSLTGPNVLHIASHGYFYPIKEDYGVGKVFGVEIEKAIEDPLLRSGILIAGSAQTLSSGQSQSDNIQNGVLTAFEAMNLDLDNTQLVVLSACETGLGQVRNGEGVYGLQRAFQVAGASNIIMSLWKINDKTTQELMVAFYENWLSGMNLQTAFYKAQLKIKSKYPHPYFWGAFVFIGN